jgi:hypothetical protein
LYQRRIKGLGGTQLSFLAIQISLSTFKDKKNMLREFSTQKKLKKNKNR